MPPDDAANSTTINTSTAPSTFLSRVTIGAVVAVAVWGVLRGLWAIVDTVLLLYLATIVGMALRGAAEWVADRTPVRRKRLALGLVLIAMLGAPIAFGAAIAPQLTEQVRHAQQELPAMRDRMDGWLSGLEDRIGLTSPEDADVAPTERVFAQLTNGPAGRMVSWFSSFVGGVGAAIGGMVLVLFIGFYTAASPATYSDGLVSLVPIRHRPRAREILDEVTVAHRRWVIGQLAAMIVVGVLTGSGLALLGVPMALLLGVLAGVLDFIPNFGPILAAVPALLVAAGTGKLLPVALLYMGVQTAEGYILRPFIERQTVDTPPALLIAVQVIMASLVGLVGLLVAPALFVLVRILVRRLYQEGSLGQPAE